jgi:hypothetical protein
VVGTTRTLAIAFFPRKFCGEAAQFELGLHRLAPMAPPGWGVVWVELDHDDQDANVRAVREAGADLLLVHANRTQMVETVAFVDAMTEQSPELALVLSGWVGKPAYVDQCFAISAGLRHPVFAVACGEIEAIIPPMLERLGDARIGADSLVGHRGVVAWDAQNGTWTGDDEFVFVEDMNTLPDASIDHISKEWRDAHAGWVEITRGCRYRCAFCFASCYQHARMRSFSPERIRNSIQLVAKKGVKVMGLYTASVSLDIDLMSTVVETFRELSLSDVTVVGALGPIDKKFIPQDKLERLSRLDWNVMTVGLQSITPEATRLARRPDDTDMFARTMEYLSGFVTPEVELILGLPGDTPAGFRQTIDFAFSLPVNVTVQTFRLDPWSSYSAQRELHGLKADYTDVGRVYESNGFPGDQIRQSADWLRGVARSTRERRAHHIALDGEQLNSRAASASR